MRRGHFHLKQTFDYIYGEPMIEHMAFDAGQSMLKECRRILSPGGTLRWRAGCAFPLQSLPRGSQLPGGGIHRMVPLNYIGEKAPHTALGVINNFVRDWGHVFIYDPETLLTSMRTAGFQKIVPVKIGGKARDQRLGNSKTRHMPSGFYELETFIFEATKREECFRIRRGKPLSHRSIRISQQLQ